MTNPLGAKIPTYILHPYFIVRVLVLNYDGLSSELETPVIPDG